MSRLSNGSRSVPPPVARFFCLLMLLALAGCASSGPTPSPASRPAGRAAGLPASVLVDDGQGRQFALQVSAVVGGGALISGFGARRHAMGGEGGSHQGIDIAAPLGTPVRAAAPGTIVELGWHGGYGRFVRIRHADHLETAYAHLARFGKDLKLGSRVNQDEVIGYVGTSGHSTGPHLHYEIRRNGRPIDPLRLPPANGAV